MHGSYRTLAAIAATLTTTAVGVMADSGSAGAAAAAKTEYQAALKAASAQSVHFVSKATEQGITLEVIGDTGKTSGSQVLEISDGSTTEQLSVVLLGATGYLRVNKAALQKVIGLTAAQSTTYTNKWLSFPSTNAALSELVSGLRNSDVASELEMSGPYTFGGTSEIAGHTTQTIKGTAPTSSGTKVPIVLYVDTSGTLRPVREVINPKAKSTATEGTVTFSNWGEQTHPKAPTTSVPLVPLLPAG